MKRNKRQIRKAKYYNLITSISSGILVIISLSCVCSYCISKIDMPESAVIIMIDFVLCAGGFIQDFSLARLNAVKA